MSELTNRRTLDDPDLVYIVASTFLTGFTTRDWHRPHEKAAVTKAKEAISVIKHYLRSCEYRDNDK